MPAVANSPAMRRISARASSIVCLIVSGALPPAVTNVRSVTPMKPKKPFRNGSWKLSPHVVRFCEPDPLAPMTKARLPVTSPFGPCGVYWNVRPTRAIWSIQALNAAGTLKL